MPSTATSILDGLSTSVAVKAPCRTVATSNITLAGLQTISGYTTVENDRVLVKGQTDPVENGIYMASTGSWTRAKDADGARDLVQGTRVIVRSTTIDGVEYELTTANPITIGTTELTFELRYGANATYDQTEAEIAAGVTVINSAIPNHDTVGYVIAERYGTNTTPGTTDMTAAVQAAVDVALEAECDVAVTTMCRLTDSINIDRQVDGADYDGYFTIRGYGGGFYVTSAIAMFSSTISFSTAPVSQLVRWKDIRFEASGTGFDAYVLDDSRFLRSVFHGCDFVKIKCMYAPTVHAQSIYFFECQMRRWTGIFFRSLNTNFDIRFEGILAEAGQDFAYLAFPVGGGVWHSTIEGMSGTAIKAWGCQGFVVGGGSYFEHNDRCLDFRQVSSEANYAITLSGAYFSHNTSDSPSSDYAVQWGDSNRCVSHGCYFTENGHEFLSSNRPEVGDFALGDLTSVSGYFVPAANEPAFLARADTDQSITTSTFTKITFGTEEFDTNGNFASSRFTPTVSGYYEFSGVVRVTGTNITQVAVSLYKNGAETQRLSDIVLGSVGAHVSNVSGIIPLNVGTSDYIELWVYVVATSPAVDYVSAAECSRFSGRYVRNL